MSLIDRLMRWIVPPEPNRDPDAEVRRLEAESIETLRRVDRVIRMRRVDEVIAVGKRNAPR